MLVGEISTERDNHFFVYFFGFCCCFRKNMECAARFNGGLIRAVGAQ